MERISIIFLLKVNIIIMTVLQALGRNTAGLKKACGLISQAFTKLYNRTLLPLPGKEAFFPLVLERRGHV